MKKEEQDYYEWFWANADFGPAHEDVMLAYEEMYYNQSGKKVPTELSYTERFGEQDD